MSAIAIDQVIATLTAEGWTATTAPHVGGDHHYIAIRSPRMTTNTVVRVNVISGVASDFEHQMRSREAEAVAYERHDCTISTTLDSVKASILGNLANLYRLQSGGKVGIEIPTEVTLNELVVPLTVPTPPKEEGA